MCRAFVDAGICIEEIENIYVLGHSFGDPDVEYFDYIDKVTRCGCNYDSLSAAERLDLGKLARLTLSHENAQWHISYFTPEDKKRIEKVMKHIGLKRYHLHEGIDQCLSAHIKDRH